MLLRPMLDYDSASIGSHPYIGLVINNNDPLKYSRVQIRIPDLHGTSTQIPDANLPWALQVKEPNLGGSSGISSNSIPRIGSYVVITFPSGDYYNPMYIGEPKAKNLTDATFIGAHYPNIYSFKDPNGNSYYVDLTSNTLTLNFSGNVTATVGGTLTATVTGNSALTTPQLTVTGNVIIDGWLKVRDDITDLYTTSHGTVNGIRTIYNTHTHEENGVTGDPDTEIPNQLIP